MEPEPTYEELLIRCKRAELMINEQNKLIEELQYSNILFDTRFKPHKLLADFADMLPIAITLVDFKGDCLYLNKFGRALSGYSHEDISKGLNVKDILANPEDIEAFTNKVSQSPEDTDNNKGEEFLVKSKDGKFFYVLIYSQIILNEDNKAALLGVLVDHTYYREVGEKYMTAEIKLRQMNAAKDRFFSIIAHDLKNPYNAILGFSELILGNIKSYSIEQISNYVNIMHKSATKGLLLLDNLLKWSMSQTGKLGFQLSRVNISELLSESIDFVSEKAAIKGIKINTICSESLMVSCDKNMIDTVLRNLLTNAIKFTRANGAIEVQIINYESNEKESNHIHVTVSDNGIGILEKDKKKLFRVDTLFSTQGTAFEQGTGLGLLLCQDFIHKHDGQIWVESEPGKGSKFHFTIPSQNLKYE